VTAVEVCIDAQMQSLDLAKVWERAAQLGRSLCNDPTRSAGLVQSCIFEADSSVLVGRSLDPQAPWRRAQISNIAVKVKGLRRSKVVVSNLSPNLRACCHEASSSGGVGWRAISAYLPRYFALPGSQKLSG